MTAELAPTGDRSPAAYSVVDHQLDDATRARLVESMPDNTRRAYEWALGEFATWCHQQGRVPLPATGQTLTEYVRYMADGLDRAPAGIEQAIGAIRSWHKASGHSDQPDTAQALQLLRLHKRERATERRGQKQAPPLTREDLLTCIGALDLGTVAGRRDHMVLLFGFMMMARRHVLAALDFADVVETPDGLDVTVRTDKTDKDSEGRTVSLPVQSHPDGDPVRVLAAWRFALAAKNAPLEGPLLRRMRKGDRPGTRLSADAINDVVRKAAVRAGLPNAELYTAHSLRSGGITDALQRGVVPGIAARHGGWEPDSPMLGVYGRAANRWRDNAMLRVF